MYRARRCSFLRVSVVALGIFYLSAIAGIDDARATTHGPTQGPTQSPAQGPASSDHLCDIPFTAGHRAALIERHIPGLRAAISDWAESHGPRDPLGDLDRDWAEEMRERLDEPGWSASDERIESIDSNSDLPVGGRGKWPGEPSEWFVSYTFFAHPFDAARIATIEGALQALAHWACRTESNTSLRRATLTLHELRGLRANQPFLYQTWDTFRRIIHRYINMNPAPFRPRVRDLSLVIRTLLGSGFSDEWLSDPNRIAARSALHLAVTDWILSADTDLGYVIGEIETRYDTNNWTNPGKPREPAYNETDTAVFTRSLDAYVATMEGRRRSDDRDPRLIFHLHMNMLRLAVGAEHLDHAACFLERMASAMKNDPALDESNRDAFESIKRELSKALRSKWTTNQEALRENCRIAIVDRGGD